MDAYNGLKNTTNVFKPEITEDHSISKEVGPMQEWYVKYASGNTMATYKKEVSTNNGHLTETELYKYGGS